MREILFRGKDKTIGEWVTGNLYQNQDQCFIMANNRNNEVIPETVGQYTGLTDKNGNKIFEGDILNNDWCFIHSPSIIRFGEYAQPFNDDIFTNHIGFYVEHNVMYHSICRRDLGYYANKGEIIGNIHDNPELLI